MHLAKGLKAIRVVIVIFSFLSSWVHLIISSSSISLGNMHYIRVIYVLTLVIANLNA
jgi:hypothetical protein